MKQDELKNLLSVAQKPNENIFGGDGADPITSVFCNIENGNLIMNGFIVSDSLAIKIENTFPDNEIVIKKITDFEEFSHAFAELKYSEIMSAKKIPPLTKEILANGVRDGILKLHEPFFKTDFNVSIPAILASIKYSENTEIRSIFSKIEMEKKSIIDRAQKEIQEKDFKTPKQTPQSQAGMISKDEYQKKASKRIELINIEMDKKWKTVEYDKQNSLQHSIAEKMYGGKDILLLGETGIGKTYNPNEIAERNRFDIRMIKFTEETDAAQLLGVNIVKQGVFDNEPSMYFRNGLLAKAFLQAQESAKNSTPTLIIFDELFRARDMSALITSLSVIGGTNEYCISLPNENEFLLLNTESGKAWFALSETIDRRNTWFTINDSTLSGALPANLYLTYDESVIQEMHSRGDLPTITRNDLKKIAKNEIHGLSHKNGEIRVPARAVYLVGTSNIGERYDVSMAMDNALFRRMAKMPVLSPKIDYMVQKVMEKCDGFPDFEIKERVEKTIVNFLESLDSRIRSGDSALSTTGRINFSTVDDIIGMLDVANPFKEEALGFGSLRSALKSKAMDFVDLEPDMTAEDLLQSPILDTFSQMVDVYFDESINTAQQTSTRRRRS